MKTVTTAMRAQIVLWLGQHGVTVAPCAKSDTIMLWCAESEWVDVMDYDWPALYEQCKRWSADKEDGKRLPWSIAINSIT